MQTLIGIPNYDNKIAEPQKCKNVNYCNKKFNFLCYNLTTKDSSLKEHIRHCTLTLF